MSPKYSHIDQYRPDKNAVHTAPVQCLNYMGLEGAGPFSSRKGPLDSNENGVEKGLVGPFIHFSIPSLIGPYFCA